MAILIGTMYIKNKNGNLNPFYPKIFTKNVYNQYNDSDRSIENVMDEYIDRIKNAQDGGDIKTTYSELTYENTKDDKVETLYTLMDDDQS